MLHSQKSIGRFFGAVLIMLLVAGPVAPVSAQDAGSLFDQVRSVFGDRYGSLEVPLENEVVTPASDAEVTDGSSTDTQESQADTSGADSPAQSMATMGDPSSTEETVVAEAETSASFATVNNAAVPACPWQPNDGRYVLDINGGVSVTDARALVSSGAGVRRIATSFSLPAGTYMVETASWDGYPGREAVTEPQESWKVQLRNGSTVLATTGATADLEDFVVEDMAQDVLTTSITTTAMANRIVLIHAAPRRAATQNGVVPVCVSFLKEVATTPEPTPEPAPEPTPEPTPDPTPLPSPESSNNLVSNGAFENATGGVPDGWTKGMWGTLNAEHVYPVSGVTGSAALVRINTHTSGDAKWAFEHVAVEAGATYTYTDRYKADRLTSLVAEYKHSDGTLSYGWLGDVPVSSTWGTAEARVLVPAGVVSLTVFHLLAGMGTLTLDNVSLVKDGGSTPPPPPTTSGAMISFTFDDAWRSQYEKALPILDKHGIRGTFYITTQYFDENEYTGFMTRSMVADLALRGHEIGGHTITHPDLTTLSAGALDTELGDSKAELEALIGGTVYSLAYPFGSYNSTVISAAQRAGYETSRTVEAALNYPGVPAHRIKSYSPTANTPIAELKAAINAAVAEGAWLVIAFHEIDTNGREYANTPAYFDEVAAYAAAQPIRSVTVHEGYNSL